MAPRWVFHAFWPPPPEPATLALLFCLDDEGRRYALKGDPNLVERIVTARRLGQEFDPGDIENTWRRIEGWPFDWRDLNLDKVDVGPVQ